MHVADDSVSVILSVVKQILTLRGLVRADDGTPKALADSLQWAGRGLRVLDLVVSSDKPGQDPRQSRRRVADELWSFRLCDPCTRPDVSALRRFRAFVRDTEAPARQAETFFFRSKVAVGEDEDVGSAGAAADEEPTCLMDWEHLNVDLGPQPQWASASCAPCFDLLKLSRR
eukprot:Rhum_TRINITY_DN14441_c3_g1::Rhum_TRINITY_DN14441_c3_g1_i1::g.89263::m.89263